MKKAVITGGMGFVGKKLTDKLLQKGYTVKVFSRSNPGPRYLENPAIEIVRVDYDDPQCLAEELEGATVVYHLAAAIFAFNKDEFWQANVKVTQNLVEAASKIESIKEFIYLSSQAASGPSQYKNNPRVEEDAPAPVSDYGITKLGGEDALKNLPARIHSVVLRAPIVYGKNDSGVSKIAAWVKRGIMVNTSSSDVYFSFVYIDDLVEALYLAAVTEQAKGQTFFVCEPSSYSWKYFINTMASAMNKQKPLMFSLPYFMLEITAFAYEIVAHITGVAPALNYDKIKEAHISGHWVCSSKKWIALTGQEFTPLPEGLKESF